MCLSRSHRLGGSSYCPASASTTVISTAVGELSVCTAVRAPCASGDRSIGARSGHFARWPSVHLLGERRPIGPDYRTRSSLGIHPGGDPTSGFGRSSESRPAEIQLYLTRRQLALAPMCATVLANNHVHNPKHLAAQAQTGGHTMTTHVHCGSLFTGDTSSVRHNATVGMATTAGSRSSATPPLRPWSLPMTASSTTVLSSLCRA